MRELEGRDCHPYATVKGKLATSLLLLGVGSGISATVKAAENNMRFHGALVAEPCVIPPGEESITLDFGTVVDKYLYLNTRTVGQAFNIRLMNCDLSLGNIVSVTFSGMESIGLPGLLAVDTGSGAQGIAIGLETSEAKPVLLNKATDQFALQAGNNLIAIRAYVQGEPEAIRTQGITRGAFTATATFSLSYE
ncbi:fimbrial protein [Enterobacter asburiae]|uniref:fimbrial protein n=1 Tax=Scandinavium sp. UTDF21-P1B TaxID=3446379 RepID=UPI00348FEB71